MYWLEMIAAAFGLVCVWLSARQNIGCWPTGLINVSLYIAIFFHARLYSDMLLQVVYVFMQLYGWYTWLYGGSERTNLPLSRLPIRSMVLWCVVCLIGAGLLGLSMHLRTDAAFPYVDAFAAVASLIAQWLMARKIVESWLVWIVVNVVSIPMYFCKELHWTAGLYLVYLGLATWGWFAWRSAWRKLATA